MPKGQKVITIISNSDVYFTCDKCGKIFTGSSKSVDMRFKAHMKKVHDSVSHKIMWPKNGIEINYDKTNLTTNNMCFSNKFVDILDEDNQLVARMD